MTDDDSIHCLKPGQVALSALETIQEGTISLRHNKELEEEVDPLLIAT